MVVKNTNWSQIEGSATFSASTKSLVGATTVFREMARLGTPACPDLAPLYSQYLVLLCHFPLAVADSHPI